jgi:hypothetical protein
MKRDKGNSFDLIRELMRSYSHLRNEPIITGFPSWEQVPIRINNEVFDDILRKANRHVLFY